MTHKKCTSFIWNRKKRAKSEEHRREKKRVSQFDIGAIFMIVEIIQFFYEDEKNMARPMTRYKSKMHDQISAFKIQSVVSRFERRTKQTIQSKPLKSAIQAN